MNNHVPSPAADLLSDLKDSTALKTIQTSSAKKKKAARPKAKPKKSTSAASPKAKAAPIPTAMPKSKASDDLVVFAFRLSAEERDLIHQASGPAKASRFVRAVVLSAARGDMKALQAIITEVHRKAAS